ncbi:hypothetical protein AB0B21_34835 [Streptomyces rimosus]|uniref:hypothetical protein n=1 Tax=Streptomyces rimosus TaxID=1927 RepID=UPI000A65A908|nr:hypothetical protein [Streptomyces rimosus]
MAGCGRPAHSGATAALAAEAETAMCARIRHACDQVRTDGGNEVSTTVAGRLAAESS